MRNNLVLSAVVTSVPLQSIHQPLMKGFKKKIYNKTSLFSGLKLYKKLVSINQYKGSYRVNNKSNFQICYSPTSQIIKTELKELFNTTINKAPKQEDIRFFENFPLLHFITSG